MADYAVRGPMSAADLLASELKRCQANLRATEDDLAEMRAENATLKQQIRAMQIVLSRITQAQRLGRSPSVEQTAGDCGATWILGDTGGRAVTDLPTREIL